MITLWPDEYEALRAEAREMSEMIAGLFQPEGDLPDDPLERARLARTNMAALETPDPRGSDEVVAGVPCRVFRPERPARGVYLDFHGGGMMVGSPALDDPRNVAYMEALDVAVVSVDYRLAPESPFPAGADDCLAVATWLAVNAESAFGTDRLLIGGESAGAYYAALTLLRLRDEHDLARPFVAANLIFGVYDVGRTPSQRGHRPSTVPDTLDPDRIRFYSEQYTPGITDEDRRAPHISPLYADLHDLPPAILTVGTADHLLDDSLFMANRWAAAGNPAELAVYPDCGHAFTILPTEMAKHANARIHAFLAAALASAS